MQLAPEIAATHADRILLQRPHPSTVLTKGARPLLQAQTLEQRRRNAKFAKDQEARMGKSGDQIKKRAQKVTSKAPISPFWIGT